VLMDILGVDSHLGSTCLLPLIALYIGPETVLPFLSALAAVGGVLLMFWQRVVGLLRQLWQLISGKILQRP
jgi:hypothetical protein